MIWFQQLTAIHAGNHSKDAVKARGRPFSGMMALQSSGGLH